MSKLSRIRQLVARPEAQEGVAENLASSDAGFLVDYVPKVSFEPEMYQRDPVRESLTKLGKITGKRPAGFDFSIKLRGWGIGFMPRETPLLLACGHQVNTLKKISIGAVTGGPFKHGETITGGTSSAQGRVVIDTPNGITTLYYVSISGVFQSGEDVGGETSGASAQTSSAPLNAGYEIKPLSRNAPSLTMASYEDGLRKLLRGCRGSVKFNMKLGQPLTMDFKFMGVEAGVIDATMLSGIDYGTTVEPVILGAGFSVAGVSLNVGSIDIDIANKLSPRDKIDDPSGILSYMITDRQPAGNMDPEMLSVAEHDFHGSWLNNAKLPFDFSYGTAEGNKFRFYCPAIQYTKVEDADKEGIQIAQVAFDLTGSFSPGDDEYCILCL
ncbi:MAG: phage tail tube protein [Candidatus Omnitrophota bacterium]|jgi:hypothetical protein